ncbi:hypothetical protein N0V94_002084 [Neodidymelliopsis sp. IMI 364377]|nr:hypothetical protein N0V94_002084 [Neodidymelliopsis sp. IMI 364377]
MAGASDGQTGQPTHKTPTGATEQATFTQMMNQRGGLLEAAASEAAASEAASGLDSLDEALRLGNSSLSEEERQQATERTGDMRSDLGQQPELRRGQNAFPGSTPASWVDSTDGSFEHGLDAGHGAERGRGADRGRGSDRGRGAFVPRGHTSLHQRPMTDYPVRWSRWLGYGEITHVIEGGIRFDILDPRKHEGDMYYNLGLCKRHWQGKEPCPRNWEECPLRH